MFRVNGGTSLAELTTGKLLLKAPSVGDPGSCASCAEGVAARMARQFGLLERLGAVTVVLAETLGAEAAKYPGSSAAEAFVQVARSLRQTVALEMRLDAERETRERRDAEQRREAAAPARRTARDAAADGTAPDCATADKAAPDDAAAGAKPADGAAAMPREDLLRHLLERPDCGEAVDELRGLPSGEVVARICRKLGIPVDLRCFTDREMGRLAGLNHAPLAKPPAALSDAEFEAALGRPSHGQSRSMGTTISPNARLQAFEAAAREDACAGGGHDPPSGGR